MSRQRDIGLTSAAESEIRSSGRNAIIVIGIDRYEGWPRLTNAVADARGAAALFGRLGFEQVAEPLLDDRATGKAIQELVTDDLRMLGPEDSLVLFYAGHGGVREHRLGSQVVKTGYLIPADASNRAATWIELDSWLRAVALLPAKHILVILDACHSGIALGPIIKWRDLGTWQSTPLPTLQARRSRRIITSALDDQVALDSGPVHGHSLFTGCLIEGLTHGLGRAGKRVVTGSELGLYVQRRVQTYPHSRQTPDFGTFDFDDRGEVVIPLEVSAAQEIEPSPPSEATPAASDSLVTGVSTGAVQPPRLSRLPFVGSGAAVLGVIAAVGIVRSRSNGKTVDPDPPTRWAAAPPSPSHPQELEPAGVLATPDAAGAATPASVPDASVAAVHPDTPPTASTPNRPSPSAPGPVPKAPRKIESQPEQPFRPLPARSSDGMLKPKGIP